MRNGENKSTSGSLLNFAKRGVALRHYVDNISIETSSLNDNCLTKVLRGVGVSAKKRFNCSNDTSLPKVLTNIEVLHKIFRYSN